MLCVESYKNCNRTYNLCHVNDFTIPTTTDETESTTLTTTIDLTSDSMIGDLTTSTENQHQECHCPACECKINGSLSLQSTQKNREVSDSMTTFRL